MYPSYPSYPSYPQQGGGFGGGGQFGGQLGAQLPMQTGAPAQPFQTPAPVAAPAAAPAAPPPGPPPGPPPQTSSQIAQSFTGATPASPNPPPSSIATSAIPTQRLSFITAQDQAKFEQLFKSAVGSNKAMDANKAKDLLLRSKLPGTDLAKIWVLADTTKSGHLLFPEFALAMYLCNLRLTNRPLPDQLPERIANEVSSMVDIISFNVPETPASRQQPPQQLQPSNAALLSTLAPQPTGFPPQQTGMPSQTPFQPQQTGFPSQQTPFQPQPTGMPSQQTPFQPQPTGMPQQQQPQSLLSQSTSFQPSASPLRPQQTSYLQPQQTAFHSSLRPQTTSANIPPIPTQPTGLAPLQSQPTSVPSLQPQPTGFPMQAQPTGVTPLQAQPTGMPGQWGFVNAPATGLPNIEALKQQLMPQPGREGGSFSTQGLSGNATIPWAVTKDEKRIYDDLFSAWDGLGKGFIGGEVAIEIMGQSGLPREDLERIWTLSDPNNRGKLNKDEFAVAMHLIYRRLNGYPVPNRLPPELVPPSTRYLNDSIGTVKSLLTQDAQSRKTSGFLSPQKTGVSYLKDHSFRNPSAVTPGFGRKDATMFKNDDDAVPYRSSARRRANQARSPSPNAAAQSGRPASRDEMSVEELNKKIHETKIMLEAADAADENAAEEDDLLDRRDRREAESIMDRIRSVQASIDAQPGAAARYSASGANTDAEKRDLRRQLQNVQDLLPQIASDVRKTERLIAETKVELIRLKDEREHPGSGGMKIVGTGPGGAVTEADRIKARARARMQARAAELAGKPPPTQDNEQEMEAARRRIEEASVSVNAERERNERMAGDVEQSVREFSGALEDGLKEGDVSGRPSERERSRWHEAVGVEDVVRDFIYDLERESKRVQRERAPQHASPSTSTSNVPGAGVSASYEPSRSTPSPLGASLYSSPSERVLSAKERAQKRIRERMAAAGLKPYAEDETLEQRQAREKREREERIRKAEEEDRRLEEERRRRLIQEGSIKEDEHPQPQQEAPKPQPAEKKRSAPPSPPKKASPAAPAPAPEPAQPTPPPQADIAAQEEATANAERERANLESAAAEQELQLAREREAAEARLKQLEEQVRQGKMRKAEEKRRKAEEKERERVNRERLEAQRREIEEARERERKLREQLEAMEETESESESEDEWGEKKPKEQKPVVPDVQVQHPQPVQPPQRIVPEFKVDEAPEPKPEQPEARPEPQPEPQREPTPVPAPAPEPEIPAAQPASPPVVSSPPVSSPPPAPPAPAAPPAYDAESKNPFFRQSQPPAPAEPAPAPAPAPAPQPQLASTNPFHNLASRTTARPDSSGGVQPNRRRAVSSTSDDWSAEEDNDEDSDDEDAHPGGGSAKQLASLLFNTMGPPRPLSAMEKEEEQKPTPPPVTDAAATAAAADTPGAFPDEAAAPSPAPPAPPAPPMPPAPPGGAPPPPPPPPPPPAGGAPPPPPAPAPPAPGGAARPPAGGADRGALLASIQAGKGLRKVQTKDRSTSSVAGRVLD